MSREIMQQALDEMARYQVKSGDFDRFDDVIKNLRQALAQPEQEHIECGYDETVGMCTNNPCCEQAQPEQAEWRKGFNAGYETANEQAEFKEIKQTEALEPIAWITDNYEQDRSATTFNIEVAKRWKEKGWRVAPLYALDEENT